MTARRQVRLLVILSIVLGVHLFIVWLLVSPRPISVKTKAEGLQLVWIPRQVSPKTASESGTTTEKANPAPRHHPDRTPAVPSTAPPALGEDNAIRPAPDWAEELKVAAKETLAKELAKKRHESDFAHVFPTQPDKPKQFAWDYAATHRIEALPGGGFLINVSDQCVFILFPFPFVFCGLGGHPANGALFDHRHDPVSTAN